MTTAAAPTAPTPAATKPRHGLAVAGLVLGILSTFFGLFAGVTWFLVIPGAVLTLVFGILGRAHGVGKAGAVLGVIALALGIWGVVIFGQAVDTFDKSMDCLDKANTIEQINACN